MNYELEIEIARPIDEVIALFDDPANLPKWQDDLLSFEPLGDTPGTPGATSRLRYKMGRREVEMIETILRHDLPREMASTYEAKGVWNAQSSSFEAIDATHTRWRARHEFRMAGMMRLLATVAPGMFKKQTYRFMEKFKRFAESAA